MPFRPRITTTASDPDDAAPQENAHRPPALQGPRPDLRDKLDSVRLISPADAAVQLAGLREATEGHIARSKAASTQQAYAADFGSFALWCDRYSLAAVPAEPDTVALYLTACADQGAAVATLRRRLERGTANVSQDSLERIAQVFGVQLGFVDMEGHPVA